ncbi:UNVERIFIED_CONTAM: LINE-1 reverse transcriptase [Sesamum latifolium]|uniref:LINE-1 reverse transcriptase n=1 Tax=Sesamum latifolium TaxID=2727402 RepID=A0AAW2U0K2_9LAMI
MKVPLQKLVHFSQNAFIPGRTIPENILLAQELLTGYNQSHLPKRCAMKIDLRKAYDTVAWDFVLAAMLQFGFHTTFINWVKECITTPTYSISVNGGPQGFFHATRGLRQGDPLSPYLFVLVMECLHATIQFHIHQDGGFAYHWKCEKLNLYMLSFVDDILLFCRAEEHSILLLTFAMQQFSELSGLHANHSKTQCFLSRSAAELTEEVLNLTGFQLGQLPGIIKEIEQRCKRFLWKGNGDRGAAKVAWKHICKPVVAGGLGIRALWPMNRALMCKHLWNVVTDNPDSIWVQWIKEYRLQNHSIWTAPATTGSWTWKKLLKLSDAMLPGLEFHIGDGSKLWLWLDPWHSSGVLLHNYPRGPIVAGFDRTNKLQAAIVEGAWAWPTRTPQAITTSLPLIHGGPDAIIWRGTSSGRFSTQTAYQMLTQEDQPVPWHTLMSDFHELALLIADDKSSYFGHILTGLLVFYGHRGAGEENTLSMLLIDSF